MSIINEPLHERKPTKCLGENKGADQLCMVVYIPQRYIFPQITLSNIQYSAEIICRFYHFHQKIQFRFFPHPKFPASTHLLWLYSPVCVGPGLKPKLLVFSSTGSNVSSVFFGSSVNIIMSLCMRKTTICIGENKAADQLRGNREADQRLCFRYMDSTIPLLLKYKISSL